MDTDGLRRGGGIESIVTDTLLDRQWGTVFGAAAIQIEGRSPPLGLLVTPIPISVTDLPEMERGVQGCG